MSVLFKASRQSYVVASYIAVVSMSEHQIVYRNRKGCVGPRFHMFHQSHPPTWLSRHREKSYVVNEACFYTLALQSKWLSIVVITNPARVWNPGLSQHLVGSKDCSTRPNLYLAFPTILPRRIDGKALGTDFNASSLTRLHVLHSRSGRTHSGCCRSLRSVRLWSVKSRFRHVKLYVVSIDDLNPTTPRMLMKTVEMKEL
jgi:hypothetical protein